jgi:hypothetical protein
VTASGYRTICVVGNHGTPGQAGSPDGPALAAAAGAGQSLVSLSLIVKDPSSMLFATLTKNTHEGPWGYDYSVAPSVTFDSEGAKYLPHTCLSCHGGTYDPLHGSVTGGTLLPIDPGLVQFATDPGHSRAAMEEPIRQINAMVAKSGAPVAVVNYINELYNGQVAQAGAQSQVNYVPSSWASQVNLYQNSVKPYCTMCHLASPIHDFASTASFFQNKAVIHSTLCTAGTMPHSETAYRAFWSKSAGPFWIPGYLLTVLGYNSCP